MIQKFQNFRFVRDERLKKNNLFFNLKRVMVKINYGSLLWLTLWTSVVAEKLLKSHNIIKWLRNGIEQ